ncbi:unannotated protein [freshwater metagenome]|uniref:Unannotated protein n=1 Tax=freshwater metagenome TaxID=449393 RepID=A0A6J7GUX8_9ZZZZ
MTDQPAEPLPATVQARPMQPKSEVNQKSVARRQRAASLRNLIEWVAVIVGAVLVAVLIKTFLVQAFRIPSESMVPTLEIGDRVLVNKLSYRAHDINRGDVVVFTRPPGLPAGPGEPEDLIKRVIGVPGDTLQAKEGSMYVNGKLLDEPYLPEGTSTVNLDKPVTIQDGQAWVMGDNRNNSQDSRVFGPIEAETVIGRAFTIMWPPGRIGSL